MRRGHIAGGGAVTYAAACSIARHRMITPLDPVIAQIIPLLPLRDPDT